MITAWERQGDYWTNIEAPDFVLALKLRGSLETRRHARVIRLERTQKNNIGVLWDNTSKLLRQERTTLTGFVLRGCPCSPASGDAVMALFGVPKAQEVASMRSLKMNLLARLP